MLLGNGRLLRRGRGRAIALAFGDRAGEAAGDWVPVYLAAVTK